MASMNLITSTILLNFLAAASASAQNAVIKDYEVKPFTHLELRGCYTVNFSSQSQPKLRLTASKSQLDSLIIKSHKGELKIATTSTAPCQEGSIVVELATPLAAQDKFELELKGESEFIAKWAHLKALDLEIKGGSRAKIEGQATHCKIESSGNAELLLDQLTCESAKIDIYGSSSAYLHATHNLTANIFGSGSVRYSGAPKNVQKMIQGSGSVEAALPR